MWDHILSFLLIFNTVGNGHTSIHSTRTMPWMARVWESNVYDNMCINLKKNKNGKASNAIKKLEKEFVYNRLKVYTSEQE